MKQVTQAEFDAFIKSYPRALEEHLYARTPPVISYNDFTLGNWPESVIARHDVGLNGPEDDQWEIDEGAVNREPFFDENDADEQISEVEPLKPLSAEERERIDQLMASVDWSKAPSFESYNELFNFGHVKLG